MSKTGTRTNNTLLHSILEHEVRHYLTKEYQYIPLMAFFKNVYKTLMKLSCLMSSFTSFFVLSLLSSFFVLSSPISSPGHSCMSPLVSLLVSSSMSFKCEHRHQHQHQVIANSSAHSTRIPQYSAANVIRPTTLCPGVADETVELEPGVCNCSALNYQLKIIKYTRQVMLVKHPELPYPTCPGYEARAPYMSSSIAQENLTQFAHLLTVFSPFVMFSSSSMSHARE